LRRLCRPAQRLEEGVDELDADLGLFVVGALVGVQVAGEPFDQLLDLRLGFEDRVCNGHRALPDRRQERRGSRLGPDESREAC
jgi:hypothetical protein